MLNGVQQLIRSHRLHQEVLGARLDGLHRGGNVGVTGKEDDRQGRPEFAKTHLQLGAAQVRDANVKKDAAGLAFIGQAVEQLLGRQIDRDIVTGPLQTALDRGPERWVVVNDMNGTRQLSLLSRRQRHRKMKHRAAFRMVSAEILPL